MNKKFYENKLKWIENKALKMGADAIRSSLIVSSGFSISQRDEEIENMSESVESSLQVEIFSENRYSYHTTNDLKEDRLEGFLEKALSMTAYLEKDEYRKLPDKKWYATETDDTKLNLADPRIENMSYEDKVTLLNRLVKSAYDINSSLISVTADFWNNRSLTVRRASNGFAGSLEKTSVGMGTSVSMEEPDGRRPEDSKYISALHMNELWEPEKVSAEAVRRVEAKLGAKKIASGKMIMIVDKQVAGRCLYPIFRALSGRALSQKNSFLEGKLNEEVGSKLFTIIDDPLIPKGRGSRIFDSEGLKAVKRPLFQDGVLKTYLIDSYYGNKLNMDPTSGGISNIILPPGNKSLNELINAVNKGIYVTGFIGGNSNATTGDFSYGIMGHEIKNGTLIRPVTEMNISGNYLDLMKSLISVGNDPNEFSSLYLPTLVFKDVDFAGL